jgi:sodium-coupled monocarboxylate transporter 8/12
MALVVYGPSLALNQVTGFDTILSVAIIFIICIFYSSLGGFRAVLWTDALQAVIMIISIAIVCIKGVSDIGGFTVLWNKLEETHRVEFFRFEADHRTRHSVWSIIFGGYFLYLTLFGGTQANIQRYVAMPDMKTVRK